METKVDYFNRFIVEMPLEAVQDCSHQGACDDDVAYWAPKIKIDATPDDIRAELKEYGAWDGEELADDKANKECIVWIAAGNIKEEMREDAKLAEQVELDAQGDQCND